MSSKTVETKVKKDEIALISTRLVASTSHTIVANCFAISLSSKLETPPENIVVINPYSISPSVLLVPIA